MSNTMLLTSNTLLPTMQEFDSSEVLKESEICGCVSMYYELRHCQAKLQGLKKLLEETSYRGETFEKQVKDGLFVRYTLEDLRERVQASENELRNGLREMEALEINGYWRILETEYREKVVVAILNLLDENSWSYDRVPMKETCDVLEELEPRFVISHCLKCYGEVVSMETEEGNEETYYKLSEAKVCTFYAEFLLRPAGRFNYYEFMEAWKQTVPEGMHVDDTHLQGIALSDMASSPAVIWHFPKDNLPSDPAMRFNKLFKTREKWTLDDIQPYLADLESPGQSLKALLLKYARCSTDATGNKVYNSKRPLN
ncbi:sister chromatid cohesion protein DCC1-like [Dendronephthya gigantea]|uniref:sister chromatid cohesion protein DCC1-like n=1 Tax=Dendronephthya gigantea TaxID=151771 RepID=UPI00106D9AA9|nr:sister chromatid cohesion protein DCC1-like [Dendronephthya gigantea]